MQNFYQQGIPMELIPGQPQVQQPQNTYGFVQQAPQLLVNPQQPRIDPRNFETPEITMGDSHKPLFSISPDPTSNPNTITVENLSDMEVSEKKRKKNNTTASKTEVNNTPIVKADTPLSGEVEQSSTIYTYQETNNLLHETLGQIDAINLELVQEFNNVKQSRTMKNKYMVLNNLSENIGSLLSNRIATIKEINNCISKSNDMDYKKYKDIQAAQSAVNDDKYIADVYQALIANPAAQAPQLQMPKVQDPSIINSGIVRAYVNSDMNGLNNGSPVDAGYYNYIANLSPEQNLMRYENDPNIKQVVVYDATSGAKFFQYMNMATGEALNNMPVYDDMIMQDTTLDLHNKIAKNININESFPIVVINDNITSQY